MAGENHGCFVWLVSFKKSCNERFARFRNRLRQRYYARRGKTLEPETLLNETGTADMEVTKGSYQSNKVVPLNLLPRNGGEKDDLTVVVKDVPVTLTASDDKLVADYVSCVLQKAADTLRQGSPSNQKLITVKPVTDDNLSMSSSIISQIADIAVTESLSNIVTEADINHSAVIAAKTVRELKEAIGIFGSDVTDDGLPPVSE